LPQVSNKSAWNWQADGRHGGRPGDVEAGLRRAALLQSAVMVGVGALVYFLLGHHLIGTIVWCLAGLCLLLGLFYPPGYRPLHRFGQWLGRAVGRLLLYLLLVPFYYLFFLAVSLILRCQRRDPLHRQWGPPDLTYWVPRLAESPTDLYERQFMREDRRARHLQRPVGSVTDPVHQVQHPDRSDPERRAQP
jgi:hypothetical protein